MNIKSRLIKAKNLILEGKYRELLSRTFSSCEFHSKRLYLGWKYRSVVAEHVRMHKMPIGGGA